MRTSLRRYSRGYDLLSMQTASGEDRVYHYDHQGTTQCLTNGATGAVTDRFASDAWGVPVKRTGNSINRLWYLGSLGYYKEPSSLLTYVRARFLKSSIGQWMSVDPLHQSTMSSISAYLYAKNLPTALVDPSGLMSIFALKAKCFNDPGLQCCGGGGGGRGKNPICRDDKCENCATTEIGRDIDKYCDTLDYWTNTEPPLNLLQAICLNSNVNAAIAYATQACNHITGDHGHCVHCMTSCDLAKACGASASEWAGWCKEVRDLTDCSSASEFSTADWKADLDGLTGTTRQTNCYDQCSQYLLAV